MTLYTKSEGSGPYVWQVEVAAVVRDVWLRNVEEKVRVVVVEGTKRPILLWKKEAISWLEDSSPSPVNETAYSFSKLRRGLRRFVLKRLLFSKFASDADLEKREKELEPIFRIAA